MTLECPTCGGTNPQLRRAIALAGGGGISACPDPFQTANRRAPEEDNAIPVTIAALLATLKEECETQHARAEAAETALALLNDERRNLIRNVFEHDDARKEALAALALQAQELDKLKRELNTAVYVQDKIRLERDTAEIELEKIRSLPSAAAPVKAK